MEKHTAELAAAALGLLLLMQFATAEEINFRFAQKRFVVLPALVDGHGPYDFLLDTGSTTSVVDKALAKELGLKPLQETVTRTASGTERVEIARIHETRVGSRSTQTVLVLISKLDGVKKLDENIRGILGFNFLSRFRYTLDYRHRTVRFDATAVAGTRVQALRTAHCVRSGLYSTRPQASSTLSTKASLPPLWFEWERIASRTSRFSAPSASAAMRKWALPKRSISPTCER